MAWTAGQTALLAYPLRQAAKRKCAGISFRRMGQNAGNRGQHANGPCQTRILKQPERRTSGTPWGNTARQQQAESRLSDAA